MMHMLSLESEVWMTQKIKILKDTLGFSDKMNLFIILLGIRIEDRPMVTSSTLKKWVIMTELILIILKLNLEFKLLKKEKIKC